MDAEESLILSLDAGTNLCMSGGADGSDLQWGLQAGKAGHGVIHWSFSEHRSQAPEQELVRLHQKQLNLADGALKRANRKVQRSFPSRSEVTNNLLRRNWYQVRDTQSLYAVSQIKYDGSVDGGTAWAIQMYLDRFEYDGEDPSKCRAYLLDKNTLKWYEWNGERWITMISRPPKPQGIWTGIGSREISAQVRVEIRKLMGTFELDDRQLNSVHPIVDEPKVDDIVYVPDRKVPGKGLLNKAGGWATVRRVIRGDRLWICVGEFSDNEEIDWTELQPQQMDLRNKYGLTRATSKPDYSPENNKLV